MTSHPHPPTGTLSVEIAGFLTALEGRNRSGATIRAYASDLAQFTAWLTETNGTIATPGDVNRVDVVEFLADLGRRDVTGVSRARKLAAIREFFRHLEGEGSLGKIPTTGVATPKRERPGRAFLRSDEYSRMLSLAGGHPRDFAILQVFLQTGVRVSELCDLRLNDVDLREGSVVISSGKGGVGRTVELEKKGIQALRSWLSIRPDTASSDSLFLNYLGDPFSERGVRKLVVKYRDAAGITKKASCHSLRHTFATHKAEAGVSPFQLKEWLGHASLETTQIYVHLARKNGRKVMEATSL